MPTHIIDTGTQSISGNVIIQGLSSTSNLQEWNNSNGTTLMTVTSAGNVGIGTTTPNQKLIVVGTGRFVNNSATTGSVVSISGAATTGSLLNVQGSAGNGGSIFTAYTTAGVGLRIAESGQMFAGTTASFSGGPATISLGGGSNTNIIRSSNSTAAATSTDIVLQGGTVDRTAGNLFQVRNNTVPVMTITALTSAGNVGIGTIAPKEKLTVVGNISGTSIIYAAGGNSDNWNNTYTTFSANSGTYLVAGSGSGSTDNASTIIGLAIFI